MSLKDRVTEAAERGASVHALHAFIPLTETVRCPDCGTPELAYARTMKGNAVYLYPTRAVRDLLHPETWAAVGYGDKTEILDDSGPHKCS